MAQKRPDVNMNALPRVLTDYDPKEAISLKVAAGIANRSKQAFGSPVDTGRLDGMLDAAIATALGGYGGGLGAPGGIGGFGGYGADPAFGGGTMGDPFGADGRGDYQGEPHGGSERQKALGGPGGGEKPPGGLLWPFWR